MINRHMQGYLTVLLLRLFTAFASSRSALGHCPLAIEGLGYLWRTKPMPVNRIRGRMTGFQELGRFDLFDFRGRRFSNPVDIFFFRGSPRIGDPATFLRRQVHQKRAATERQPRWSISIVRAQLPFSPLSTRKLPSPRRLPYDSCRSLRTNCTGSIPMASATSKNSIMSKRLSADSNFETYDCGLLSRRATSS